MASAALGAAVLLIEDDADIRDTLCELLQYAGYQVTVAESGRDALRYLENGNLPRVILLDFMMPEMNGFEFRTLQQRNPAWAAIPVIVLSADRNTAVEARAIGALGSLRKPLDIDLLLQMLGRACPPSPTAAAPPPGAA